MVINIYIILLVLFYLYYFTCIILLVLFYLYYFTCIILLVLFYLYCFTYIYTALKEGGVDVVEPLAFPFTFSMVTRFQFAGKRSPNILFPIAGPNHLSG